MVKLQYSFEAREDFKNIYAYIAVDSVFHAKRFISALKEKIKILKDYPEIGSLVYPEKFKNLRQLLFKSYRVVYFFSGNVISIVTIHHQSRLLSNIPAINDYTE